MADLFGEQRRMNKLRVSSLSAVADDAVIQKTPSLLRDLPRDLSPIRSESEIPIAVGDFDATRRGVLSPTAPGSLTLSRAFRSPRRRLLAGAIGLLVVVGGIFALSMVFRSQPGLPPPPVAEVPQPVATPGPEKSPPASAPTVPLPASTASPTTAAGSTETATKPALAKRAAKGRLSLDTTPWVEVFVNGRSLGETPLLNVPLPAGRNVLKLVNEAKGIHSAIEVEIEPGKTTLKKLNL
jgi:hypothetical protein